VIPCRKISVLAAATLLVGLAAVAQAQTADLAISKTDGVAVAVAGGNVTYTIIASNPVGPDPAPISQVTDTFPPEIVAVSWSCVAAGGAACGAALGAGNINEIVSLPVGGSVTYTATATLAASATGMLINTAEVTALGGVTDPNPANDQATDVDTIVRVANLAITKTDGAATSIPGTAIVYTITASNPVGPSDVVGATVTDVFPPALSGITWTCVGAGGGTCTGAGAGNINDVVNLPVGATVTYTVNATIASGATGVLNNTATVAVPFGVSDPNLGNNSSQDSNVLTPEADLAIAKMGSVDPVIAGTNLVYTVTTTNNGPSDAVAVVLNDVLPAQVVFVAAPGCIHDGSPVGGTVVCNLGTIVASNAVVRNITVTVLSSVVDGATITNNASVNSPTTDPGPSANAVMLDTTVEREPDLGVTKIASVDPVIAGTSFVYTVTVTNDGPSDASLVELTDTLPIEVTFNSAPGCVHDGAPFGGVVTCPIGDLVAGGSVVFVITSTVDPCTPDGAIITNAAEVTHNPVETDPGPTPNSFNLDTTVMRVADLSITKSDTPDPQFAGLNVTYTVTVANAGPSCAETVNVLDTFAPDMLFLDGQSDPSCFDFGTTAQCPQGTMVPGQVIVLTLVGKVSCAAANGSIQTNNVTVSSPNFDPNLANNAASTNTAIETQAELRITKTDAPDPVQPQSNLTYTIEVFNDGPSDALGVVVTDPLPAGLRFLSGSPGCAEAAGVVTCSIGTVPCGKRDIVRIRTRVETDQSLTNTASVTTATDEPNLTDNSATTTTSIRSGGGLQMRMSGAPRALREGGVTTAVYLIRVRNKSLLTVNGVEVINQLPAGVTFTEAVPSPSSINGNELVFELPGMAPFESRAIVVKAELVAETPAGTLLPNTATLLRDGVPLEQITFTGNVRPPGASTSGQLRAQITVPRQILAGSRLNATLDIVNTGRREGQDVVVTLTRPAILQLESASPPPSSTVSDGAMTTFVWEIPSLRGPSNVRIKWSERVPLDAVPGSELGLSATVTDASGRSGAADAVVRVRD